MDKWELEGKLAKYLDSNPIFKDHCFITVLILHTEKNLIGGMRDWLHTGKLHLREK